MGELFVILFATIVCALLSAYVLTQPIFQTIYTHDPWWGGGYSDFFLKYVGSGYFSGFQILNFNIFGGFQKK